MHTEVFRYFIELEKHASLGKAADALFITQQGLSKAVSTVEQNLNCKLVTRSHKGVSLTAEGKVFLRHAKTIISDYDNMLEEMAATQALTAEENRIPLTVTPYLLHIKLGLGYQHDIFDFVGIQDKPFNKMLESLNAASGDELFLIDMCAKTKAEKIAEGSYRFEPLFVTSVGVLWRRDFPWQDKRIISCEQLARLPVAYSNDSAINDLVSRMFAATPLENVVLKSPNGGMLIEWAQSGRAVSLFDSFSYYLTMRQMPDNADELVFTPLEGDADYTIGFLYRRDKTPNPQCRLFIRNLRKAFIAANSTYPQLIR
jgi:DNA-binding transcriptional LysR family regulator